MVPFAAESATQSMIVDESRVADQDAVMNTRLRRMRLSKVPSKVAGVSI